MRGVHGRWVVEGSAIDRREPSLPERVKNGGNSGFRKRWRSDRTNNRRIHPSKTLSISVFLIHSNAQFPNPRSHQKILKLRFELWLANIKVSAADWAGFPLATLMSSQPLQSAPAKTKVMIVDDDPSARSRLELLLQAHPELHLVAAAGGVAEGIDAFRKHQPDLLLLDVEMNDGTGFDLLPHLDPLPKIIFVTAHPHFAVKAFEVKAVDYLLKPVFAHRLQLALERILEPVSAKDEQLSSPGFQKDDVLFLRTSTGSVAVTVPDIAFIEAERNFSHVHATGGRRVMVYRTLGQWEDRLPNDLFCRVDRSLILNLSRVEKLRSAGLNLTNLHLQGIQSPVPIGRSAYKRLRSILEL
jgi:two-component system LytT family response regulator